MEIVLNTFFCVLKTSVKFRGKVHIVVSPAAYLHRSLEPMVLLVLASLEEEVGQCVVDRKVSAQLIANAKWPCLVKFWF